MNSPSDEGDRMEREAQEVSDHDDEDHDPQHVYPSTQQGWWCRRNPKWSVCVLCAVAILVGATVVFYPYEQEDIYYPYRDLIQSFNLSTESSDETIQLAIDTMNEHYRTQCKGGSVLAVTRNGGQRVIVSQGVMTIGTNSTMDANTLFEIGSISKPFTGLVLANQITTGILSLDTPLNDLLPSDTITIPDLIVQGKLVTLRQLVTHTAGFPRESQYVRQLDQLDPYDYDPLKDTTEETFLREIAIAANKGLGQSGTYEYSNFGFSILAYLLGKNATTPFPDLQKAMTDRLNMTNTYIETVPSDVALSRLSTGYIMPGSKPAPYMYDSGLFLNGPGSTVSSTTDLLQFVETLLATDVYSVYPNATVYDDTDTLLGQEQEQLQEALRLSLTPLNEFGGGTGGMAFAWFYGYFNKSTNADSINFVHSGGTFGFSTIAAFQPKSQTGVVGLTNCRTGDIQAMGYALAFNLYQN
jgi:D-alanyl-D-alanine-carboxypeptidase/D-alanyl-D-alanine-endopeptidase